MVIEDLFADVHVLATHEVASAFGVSEAEARELAEEIGVRKIGASFAWASEDVAELKDLLETDEAESDDGADNPIDPEGDESEEDLDEAESEEDLSEDG